MKRLAFLATAAGLFLISNAPPGPGPDPDDYPPCSARVTDDCIQRERGEPESRALDAMPPEEASGARARSYEPAPAPRAVAGTRTYPRCSGSITDSCIQGRGGYARPVRHARHARRVRHAGERG
jgi:hypothetical protein